MTVTQATLSYIHFPVMNRYTTLLLLLVLSCGRLLAQPGSLDPSFGTNGIGRVNAGTGTDVANRILVDDEGRVVIAGTRMLGWSYTTMQGPSAARFLQNGSIDETFGQNGSTQVMYGTGNYVAGGSAFQPDGKLIVAGATTMDNTGYDYVATRWNANGTIDESFGTSGHVHIAIGTAYDFATSVVIQADGRIVIGGYTQVGSTYQFGLVRLNPDGSPDTGFGTGGIVRTPIDQSAVVRSLRILPDGRILALGLAHNGTQYNLALAQYDVDGTLDDTFSGDGTNIVDMRGALYGVNIVGMLPDGGVLISGTVARGSDYPDYIARLTSQGELDAAFADQGILHVEPEGHCVEISWGRLLGDGRILFAGSMQGIASGDTKVFLARYTPDGAPDTAFADHGYLTMDPTSGKDECSAFDLRPDGTIVFATNLEAPGGHGFSAGRCDSNGVFDSNWGTSGFAKSVTGKGIDWIYDLAVDPENRIIATGQSYDGANANALIARFTPDGRPDSTFGMMGSSTISMVGANVRGNRLALQPDGKYVVVGERIEGNKFSIAAMRFNADGTMDNSFGNSGVVITEYGNDDDGAFGVAVQSDGKIVATGYAFDGSIYQGVVLRYNSDGTMDQSFGSGGSVLFAYGTNEDGDGIAIQADGKILVTGRTTSGSATNTFLLRLNTDGTLDNSFGSNGTTIVNVSSGYDGAYVIRLQNDGKIITAGWGQAGGSFIPSIMRFNTDGTLDQSFASGGKFVKVFNAGWDEYLSSLAIQEDGKIVAGGSSGHLAGQWNLESKSMLVRLDQNGALDNSFGNNGVAISTFGGGAWGHAKIDAQKNGKIIVGTNYDSDNQTDVAVVRVESGLTLGVDRSESSVGEVVVYPSILTDHATLQYQTFLPGKIDITLIDVMGNTVMTIAANEMSQPGHHTLAFDTGSLPHGFYIVRLRDRMGERDIKVVK